MGTKTRDHSYSLKGGINRSVEFERKGLAEYAINVGTKCSHGCTYCSTGAMLRCHDSFGAVGEDPFLARVRHHPIQTRPRESPRMPPVFGNADSVQLCTTVDAWSPEAQRHELGRPLLGGYPRPARLDGQDSDEECRRRKGLRSRQQVPRSGSRWLVSDRAA